MSSPSAPSTASADLPRVALDVTNARRWTIVWLLFAASLINYFDRQTLAYALPLLAKDFHLDKAMQGLVVSAFFWTYTSLQIPIGLCADRFNLRWLDRKSTRLNSSHVRISYAVFCLKKKKYFYHCFRI